ncbi:16S rRNA (cytosine(1402)-N(4))-methyltransferase RsmH [bacterium]|nr:16S rRNA (cytosine(1402)-N(4))-methyltransferase RsmH [bacterium]
MHQTVLLLPAVDHLHVQPGGLYLDATFGAGGHTGEILKRGGRVVALDYDELSVKKGQEKFAREIATDRLRLFTQNFVKLNQVVGSLGDFVGFDGMIFDLGTSTDQLMSAQHGLSVYTNGPLDMRLDKTLGVSAHDLLQALSEKQLIELFDEFGGETESRRIAREIVLERKKRGPEAFATSFELANLVSRVKKNRLGKLHPATKVFQALRIAVNDEIGNLERVLPQIIDALKSGGYLVMIAFHEGEDRPVKKQLRAWADEGLVQLETKKPIMPDEAETTANPRSRSAKMRVARKL